MEYLKKSLPVDVAKKGGLLLLAAILILLVSFFVNPQRAFFNYLWIYMFLVSIGVGSLAVVALEYLVGATWSTPFRRVSEFLSSLIPLLIILVIPLLFSFHSLFHWSHHEAVDDIILKSKFPYLNIPFFIIRVAACLGIWLLFYLFFIKNSEKQDLTGDPVLTKRNIRASVIFAPVFFITLSITSIDWMMSLEPHWYSTIFGVYYFAGTIVTALSATTLISILLMEKGYLHPKINNTHFYSLGTLMFGFNLFWSYIAFSQYMLIWYADIPEETFWFIDRWDGNWKFVSIALVFIHFVVPFLVLMPRSAKTNLKTLKFMSVWLLFAHALDLYWLIMPTYFTDGAGFDWREIAFPLFVIGIIAVLFKIRSDKTILTPIKDPKLETGLNFHL